MPLPKDELIKQDASKLQDSLDPEMWKHIADGRLAWKAVCKWEVSFRDIMKMGSQFFLEYCSLPAIAGQQIIDEMAEVLGHRPGAVMATPAGKWQPVPQMGSHSSVEQLSSDGRSLQLSAPNVAEQARIVAAHYKHRGQEKKDGSQRRIIWNYADASRHPVLCG